MISNLLQASVIRFYEAKALVYLPWEEDGNYKYCGCHFYPTDLLRQQVKILDTQTNSNKTVLTCKK